MESFVPIVIIIIILILRTKQIRDKLKKNKNLPLEWNGFKLGGPQPAGGSVPVFLGGKDLEKIISVYGQGSQLTVDDVGALLNCTSEKAQGCLDALVAQGRAQLVQSTGGKVKYKLT